MQPHCYVGTSGFHYEHWRGLFYPSDLSKQKWLDFYAQHFSTLEINNSFYHLPSERAFTTWRDSSPQGFIFAVKVSRLITHLKKLKNVGEALENFIARARLLGDKLGPLLYQLPPNLHCNLDLLDGFLSTLPQGLAHVFEFRHSSWFDDGVFELLRRHRAGFCIIDLVDILCPRVVTADFAYLRFHGTSGYYWGSYADEQLKEWADWIIDLGSGVKRVYVYFNNDAEAYAVRNALTLRRFLVGS